MPKCVLQRGNPSEEEEEPPSLQEECDESEEFDDMSNVAEAEENFNSVSDNSNDAINDGGQDAKSLSSLSELQGVNNGSMGSQEDGSSRQ